MSKLSSVVSSVARRGVKNHWTRKSADARKLLHSVPAPPQTTKQPHKILYHTKDHLWLKIRRTTPTDKHDNRQHQSLVQATAPVYTVEIGLSQRGCDDVGSVLGLTKAHQLHQLPVQVEASDDLLAIDWEGHTISDADELYHTKWGVLEESTPLRAPVAGLLVRLADAVPPPGVVTPEMVLAELRVDRSALQQATGLVSEEAYARSCEQAGAGRFGRAEAWSPVGDFVFEGSNK